MSRALLPALAAAALLACGCAGRPARHGPADPGFAYGPSPAGYTPGGLHTREFR